MELTLQTTPAVAEKKFYSGSQNLVVAAGKTLVMETTPDGEEILSFTLPSGGADYRVDIKLSAQEL